MSPMDRIAAALARIASATSIVRVKAADQQRIAVRGGPGGELLARMADCADRLERLAVDLEDGLR